MYTAGPAPDYICGEVAAAGGDCGIPVEDDQRGDKYHGGDGICVGIDGSLGRGAQYDVVGVV